LNLSKKEAELLASRSKVWNLLHQNTEIDGKKLTTYFNSTQKMLLGLHSLVLVTKSKDYFLSSGIQYGQRQRKKGPDRGSDV
jgi:hypothetical protein